MSDILTLLASYSPAVAVLLALAGAALFVLNQNRIRSGQPVPEGFYSGGEVVPLTRIYEDLEIHRLVLTEEFHRLFLEKANLAMRAINTDDPQEYERLKEQWVHSNAEVRAHAEKVFGMGQIRY